MGIRAIVFDFDGTLVESNQIKYDVYFELFPSDSRHARIIRDVLSESFEQTRYVILEEILRRLGVGDHAHVRREVNKLAERYNDIVLAGAKTCPERPGAEKALRRLASVYPLYLSSTTPQVSLEEIIRFRKWDGYFRAVFGYPHEKTETLRRIMALEKAHCDQVLVVGDGESDRKSAAESGCPFAQVTEAFDFENLEQIIAHTMERPVVLCS
jgi:phosphoglycolate phosphatase